MTTIETVTAEQIRALRTEAREAGDTVQALLCTLALDGDESAKADCVAVIADAEARADRETSS